MADETLAQTSATIESTALGGGANDAGIVQEADADTALTEPAQPADVADIETVADVPETYTLTPPEGLTLDPADIEAATPVFKELGLSNEAASKLLPVAAQFAERIASKIATDQLQQVAAWRKETLDAARSDPEIGGAKWDETIARAAKGLDTLGFARGTPFRNKLDESGWGNDRDMIAAWAKVGALVGEDPSFLRGDAGAAVTKSAAQVLYGQSK